MSDRGKSDPKPEKPTTNGFVTTSRGTPVKVDELDMAVLNLGHGQNPMTNQHLNSGQGNFRRPVYNVEPGITPSDNLFDHQSHEVPGDANNPDSIRRATGLQQFDQIHAVNPYAYDPVTTASSLLAPTGKLVVTGTKRNPFANPVNTATTEPANIGTRQEPNMVPVPRMSHTTTDLSPPQSTSRGELDPVHDQFQQNLSSGQKMSTASSQSHTYQNQPRGYHDVTPGMDELLPDTQGNTQLNTGPRMSVAEANRQWQDMDRPSPRSQSASSQWETTDRTSPRRVQFELTSPPPPPPSPASSPPSSPRASSS